MRTYSPEMTLPPSTGRWCARCAGFWLVPFLLAILLGAFVPTLCAQVAGPANLSIQAEKLAETLAHTQAQLEESQRQLNEMRQELNQLRTLLAQSAYPPAAAPADPTPAALDELRERQEVHQSQIATLAQEKVESESKYPVTISGLLLFNAFVNTHQVDQPATPTLALAGVGSTGATVRQTLLGFDARGPRLFGAQSFADLRVDFNAGPPPANSPASYTGNYAANTSLLRLRTAHAFLHWPRAEAFFSLDRPLFSPDTPASLTAVAEPGLAWSGNLWTWNPQFGATYDLPIGSSRALRFQASLIDVADAPVSFYTSSSPASAAESSRWPGVESRIALLGSAHDESGTHFGLGGYFSPHRSPLGYGYDAWAGTADTHLRLPAHFDFTANAYRGLALGGLGGGAFKDLAVRPDPDSSGYYFRPLDDIGGWAQLKEKPGSRLEFNAAFGMDQIFAREFLRYAVAGGSAYQNLVANRTYTANVIFSPSAYLLFSVEYRHLNSSPAAGAPLESNIVGLAAGYKF